MSKKSGSRERISRRTLFKSGLMVLGASLIVQPSGAVFGLAQAPNSEEPKKDIKVKPDSKTIKSKTNKTDTTVKHKTTTATHKTTTHKGTHKVTTDTPKKEGS